MARVRLTKRNRKAVEDKILYPGTVNQDDRKFKKQDQYHTFKHSINHETPDMRSEWKDNPRDEIGFGVPKVAKIYAAAQQAVRLAVLFLGDKCDQKTIEAQARDFMRMGSARLATALKRFKATEELYESQDQNEAPAVEDNPGPANEGEEEEKEEAPAEEAPAEKKEEEAQPPDDEEAQEDDEEACDEKEQDDEEVEGEDLGDTVPESQGELDIELQSQEVMPEDEEPDAELEAIFSQDDGTEEEEEEEEDEKESSKKSSKKAKKGVKTLGGQPKVAKTASADELVGLWADAPNVSDIF